MKDRGIKGKKKETLTMQERGGGILSHTCIASFIAVFSIGYCRADICLLECSLPAGIGGYFGCRLVLSMCRFRAPILTIF